MRHIIKTSFILATIVLGAVLSQTPEQNSTAANGTAVPSAPQNGTQPSGSGPRPSGSGVMRSGNAPQGPSNLPPQEPGITDKLAAITDTRLVSLRNILQFLPPVEQDLIADCFNSNNDATRLIAPDCYKSNFTETVRRPLARGMSDVFTNSSKSNKKGLGCLKKVAESFGASNDTTTETINTDVNNAVTEQIPLNQATSSFVTTVLSTLNARRKFFLTTSNVLNESISGTDADGFATGFVFNAEEQKTIVSAFRVYANYVYNYFSNLNTKVSSIQGLIGKLNACAPPTETAPAKRLLQAPTYGSQPAPQQGSQPAPQQGSQPAPQQGSQPAPQQGSQPAPQQGSQPTPQQGSQPAPQNQTMNGSAMNPSGMPPKGQNGTNSMNETGSGMRPDGSGKRPEGGKQTGKDGRPQATIPENIANLQAGIITALESKTGAWAVLRTEISNNLNATSGYKPNGGLMRSILQRVSGSTTQAALIKEFSKFKRSTESACPNDYLFYCRDGVCACDDNSCPAELSSISTITLATSVSQTFSNKALRYLQSETTAPNSAPANGTQPSGSQMGPNSAPSDMPTAYFICSVCFSGKRYIYGQASFSRGNYLDFADGSGNNFGREDVKQKNNCANALASGSDEQKKQCRGNMSDDCAKKMDNTCGATGLYNMLVNNPVPQSALPAVCDDTVTGYSESACFQWLVPKMTKATIVFDYRRFKDLPREIASSYSNTTRLLESEATVKVVAQDPVQQKDPTAAIPSNVALVTTTEIAVDGATVTSAPTADQYVQDLAQTSAEITLAQSFLSASFTVLIALFALLF